MSLPEGCTSRPLTFDDVDAVVELANTCERHDTGVVMLEREDVVADLRQEGVDLHRDTVGVFEGDAIVGSAMLPSDRGAWVDVHPEVRGRGIGTWLRLFTERRARERGFTRVGQTIHDRSEDAVRFLVDAGYAPRRTAWILTIDHPERPADPRVPEGIVLRHYRPDDEDEAFAMFEDAFAEWPDRTPSSLTTWRALTIEREGFEPEDLVLAVADEEVVGGAFLIESGEIWVDKLAVRRDHRHRGVARALLQTAFQRSFDRGYTASSLSTDSDTGALTLYDKLGMRVSQSHTHYALDLG